MGCGFVLGNFSADQLQVLAVSDPDCPNLAWWVIDYSRTRVSGKSDRYSYTRCTLSCRSFCPRPASTAHTSPWGTTRRTPWTPSSPCAPRGCSRWAARGHDSARLLARYGWNSSFWLRCSRIGGRSIGFWLATYNGSSQIRASLFWWYNRICSSCNPNNSYSFSSSFYGTSGILNSFSASSCSWTRCSRCPFFNSWYLSFQPSRI